MQWVYEMIDETFFVPTYASPPPLKYHEAPYPCFDVWVDFETGLTGMVATPSKFQLGDTIQEIKELRCFVN